MKRDKASEHDIVISRVSSEQSSTVRVRTSNESEVNQQ
jgi:hypothetical protein